jgi:uncharacterized protein (UPF0335 family)
MEDAKTRFLRLKEENNKNQARKIRLEEQMRAAKKQLVDVMDEIKGLGIDPKNIGEVLKEKEAELENALASLESEVSKASEALSSIEDKL